MIKYPFIFTSFFIALSAALFFLYSPVYAQAQDTAFILTDSQGRILLEQNSCKQLIPASILKILTSLAAIRILGENYHFATGYYYDEVTKDLYIKGFGDPLLVSEVIGQLCEQIHSTIKKKQIRHIILDQTHFIKSIKIPGKGSSLNPYDASSGALCANFNTINFKWDKEKKGYVSAEPQTPLLDIFLGDIKKTRLKKGRIKLSMTQSRIYAGLLIQYFLEQKGTIVTGSVMEGELPVPKDKTLFFYSPFGIKEIVQKLLKHSNNFIANQLLLTIGAHVYNPPATIEKGVLCIESFLKTQFSSDQTIVFEGSGISRANRISPNEMLKILVAFKPYHYLLRFENSDFYKTGTLHNVRTRAGFLLGKDQSLYPYVIMVNQTDLGYESILNRFYDRVKKGTE